VSIMLRRKGRQSGETDNKVDDGVPRVAVVDVVAEARGVDHSELDLELLLLEFSLDDVCFEGERGEEGVSSRIAHYSLSNSRRCSSERLRQSSTHRSQ
jgi:hypothetical protein